MRISTSDAMYYLDPREFPPPLGAKVLLLTDERIAVIGCWQDGMIGWHPLPKIPPSLKREQQ